MGFLRWLPIAAFAAAAAADTFTPSKMISAPRRSEAVPNKSGKTAFFSVSTYSFSAHKRSSQWNLLDIGSGEVSPLTNDSSVSEIAWIDDKTILYVNGSTAVPGGIELWVTAIDKFQSGYKAASIPAPLANLKLAATESGINFLLTGKAYPNGTAYNEELAEKPLSTARVYDYIMVRWWDTWLTDDRPKLFAGTLAKKGDKYSFTGSIKNLLAKTPGLETPVGPFGGSGDFAITSDGKTVAFLSKDPDLPRANFTSSYIYIAPHDGSKAPEAVNSPKSKGTPKNARGASASPNFSPDGKTLVYLQMDEDIYESDRNKIYTTQLGSGKIEGHVLDWDRSPAAVQFSPDGKSLYLQTEDTGREKIFTLPLSGAKEPKALTKEGYVSAFHPLKDGSVLASNSSLISSTGFYLVSKSGVSKPLLEPYKIDTELKGLNHDQVEEFWYQGNFTKIHGWIVKPIDFDSKKKYPLSFLIHGGPQGSWANSWSIRWNPAVFANQGHVAVAINPTGSTGYGEKLQDAIQNDWGGAAYDDLVKGFDYVVKTYPYIDGSKATASGASFGGYMINYIQGMPLGRKFKALVCHDGVFSTLNQYATEELWFMQHDFNGTLWDNYENYAKFNPAALTHNWATPELVIHNDLDFRLPVAEGIAAFNILQERGVPSKFLNFPDENHWVLKPENALVWQREVLGWINKWAGLGPVKL